MFLDGFVGLFTAHALADCCHEDLRRREEREVPVELGIDDGRERAEILQHGQEGREHAVEREERIRKRDATHDGAADVALVPLVTGQLSDHGDVAAEDHGEPVHALAGAGVHLVRHGRRSDLAFLEAFGDELVSGHEPDGRRDVAGCCSDLREGCDDVEIEAARIDLTGGGQDRAKAKFVGDALLEFRQLLCAADEIKHVLGGAHRPLDPARRIAGDELLEALESDEQFVRGGGEPLPERGDLGGDVVGTSRHRGVRVLPRQSSELGEGRDDSSADDSQRIEDLELLDVLCEVTRRHALVDVLVPGERIELLDARLHVMPGDPLAIRDGFQIHLVDDRLVGRDHFVGVRSPEIHAKVPLSTQDGEPQLSFGNDLRLRRPDSAH